MQKANAEKAISDGVKRSEAKHKKREKYIPLSEPLALPFCRVCGKRASGIHFGVYSCEACKAFFRRYLQRKTPFTCNKGNKCVIDEQKKGIHCSACRLQKCLDTGMSKAGVRIGRYSTAERTNVILEVKRLTAAIESSQVQTMTDTPSKENESPPSRDNMPSPSEGSISPPSLTFSASQSVPSKDASHLVTNMNITEKSSSDENETINPWTFREEESPRSSDSSKSDGPEISSDSTDSQGMSSGLEINNSQTALYGGHVELGEEEMNQILNQLMTSYQCLQPFSKKLTEEELDDIFKYGLEQYEEKVRLFGKMEFLSIKEYKEIYDKTQIDVDGRKDLYSFGRAEMTKFIDEYVRFSHGIVDFTSLPIKDQSALIKASHFDFGLIVDYRAADPDKGMLLSYTGKPMYLSECCPHVEVDTIKGWADFCRDVQKLRLNPQEHALMLAICLTFQDRCPLQAPEKVEEIQHKLIKTLELLVRKTNQQDGGKRLAKILNVFVRLRDYNKDADDMMETMAQDELLIECIPEILFFF